MALSADMRLFARKGEAAPARVAVDEDSTEVSSASAEPAQSDHGAGFGGYGPADTGGLAFLIQRRKPAFADDPPPKKAAIAATNGQSRERNAAGGKSLSGPAQPSPERPPERTTKASATTDEAPEAWRKLSFRVRQDQYRKLKALSGLWGASYQGILERAVAAFVDSAIGAENTDWDA